MVERIHGSVFHGEALTKKFNYYMFNTILDITVTNVVREWTPSNPYPGLPWIPANTMEPVILPLTILNSDGVAVTYTTQAQYQAARDSQRRFDALVRSFSIRTQPVIIGDVQVVSMTPPVSDIPAAGKAGDPAVTVFAVTFATEHQFAWDDPEILALSLDGIEGFVYNLGDTSKNNVAVSRRVYAPTIFTP